MVDGAFARVLHISFCNCLKFGSSTWITVRLVHFDKLNVLAPVFALRASPGKQGKLLIQSGHGQAAARAQDSVVVLNWLPTMAVTELRVMYFAQ